MRALSEETDLIKDAGSLVEEARRRELTLRIMGATAIRIHCPQYSYLHRALERTISDLDFASYWKQRLDVGKLFKDLGYSLDRSRLVHEGRSIFYNLRNNRTADVFFDQLNMCHTIDLRKRLEIDYPTIPLADLLLEKMQIVDINEKDIKDTIILLREHNIGRHDEETVNTEYLAGLLYEDWGFYYTATTNIMKVKHFLNKYSALTQVDIEDVASKASRLLELIEKEPKSLKWKMRAKIGPRKKWYSDVEELERR